MNKEVTVLINAIIKGRNVYKEGEDGFLNLVNDYENESIEIDSEGDIIIRKKRVEEAVNKSKENK